ncbi:MAG: MoaD/ThiS family protein [Candidatus Bathyarchaeia archaeon]
MHVNIVYLTIFREITGKREETIEIPSGSTLMDLLKFLAKKYGKKFEEELFNPETNEVWSHNKVLIDGKFAEELEERYNSKINDGSKIIISQAVSGG